MMSEFTKRYENLNENQKKAVDTVDGPVMVVAGPGTGKTELLSVRVANILQKTDVLPGNILCLTFTDSAAANMRERLSGLLGPDAYKVAIHTFHSFGSEIINQHGDFFYSGAQFRAADDLSRYELLSGILETLPHGSLLASTMNGQFTYLKAIQTTISELKRGGLVPDELDALLTDNDAFVKWLKPRLTDVFGPRISKRTLELAEKLADELDAYPENSSETNGFHSLHSVIAASLRQALQAGGTKPLTAWKKTYLEKDAHDQPTLKDEKNTAKLREVSDIYRRYLLAMQEHALYDYDDMILRATHALEVFDDLRYSLQEQYQYILVDEFQDTNDVQMRLVWNLTNNPVTEGRPNLMVVGDDDQAIYRFQGANLSNILDFTTRYRDVKVITLTDNYRSDAAILQLARQVITQGSERLETSLDISKHLTPHHAATRPLVRATSHETPALSYAALVQQIHRDIAAAPQATRAVIARHHRQLAALLPHLTEAHIPVRYERQDNVTDSELVVLVEDTAHVFWHIANEEFADAHEHLARVLTHPAWGISAVDIWELSLQAYRDKTYWLENMLSRDDRLRVIGEWFVTGAQKSRNEPLEYMLDYIVGIAQDEAFSSPYAQHFFGAAPQQSSTYVAHLANLQQLRTALRDYLPQTTLYLDDFVHFLSLHHDLELTLTSSVTVDTDDNPVVLLSAHKAKGLEFDAVYVLDAHDSVWGSSASSGRRPLRFPTNIPLSPAGDSDDERLRLLYVALTRARNELHISTARQSENGKPLLPVGALSGTDLTVEDQETTDLPQLAAALETEWHAPLLTLPKVDQQRLLTPLLEQYRLSATHLNNYLDVTKGGPEFFLLRNLLHLPEAMSPHAVYGSAVHAVLQRAHQHLSVQGTLRPVEDCLREFETALQGAQLSDGDRQKFIDRGTRSLTSFFEQRSHSFTPSQQVERSFSGDHVRVGDAQVTGALDLIDIDHDEKTIFVTDYKTGKPVASWKGRTDYERLKLHHYEQQLMMYKLLVEHSRQFTGYTVTGARIEFVEPDERDEIVLLDYAYSDEKLTEFTTLVEAVWRHIQALDFTLADTYDPTLAGVLAFEAFLRTT